MSGLRDAIFWNVASAPVRVALGIAQSAVLARALYLNSGENLASFALIAASVATAILVTSGGIPQVFSRVTSDYIARGNYGALASFVATTALFRTCVWIALGSLSLFSAALILKLLPDALSIGLRNPAIFLLWLLWGWLYDLSGLTGRLLSGAFEQKWQHIVNALSQVFSILITAIGLAHPEHSLALAITGMVVMYGVRTFGHAIVAFAVLPMWNSASITQGLSDWYSEKHQILHTSLDKVSAYLLSSHFVLLVAGYLFSSAALASLFLVLDLSSKVVAILAVPLGGIVVPAFARARAVGTISFQRAVAGGFGATRLFGFTLAVLAGALAVPTAELLYGRALAAEPAFALLVLGALAVEFMIYEITGAYMSVQSAMKRLWTAKVLIAAIAMFIGGTLGLAFASALIGLASFFAFRLVLAPYVLFACGVMQLDIYKSFSLVLGVCVSCLIAQMFYQSASTWFWPDIALAVTVAGVSIFVALRSILLSDFNLVRELVATTQG